MKTYGLLILVALLLPSCGGGGTWNATKSEPGNMVIKHRNGLVFYFPQYKRIDLVTETMPSPEDESVLMCCEAAFTGERLEEFKHGNIGGNHVSGGKLYKGYVSRANTGAFAYYPDDGTWVFSPKDYSSYVESAARRGGMAFGQALIIHNGEMVVDTEKRDPVYQTTRNMYRALAEYDGKLCIIDAGGYITYQEFIHRMSEAGVSNALYLDMGSGWNYSFYRGNDGRVRFIHDTQIPYTTNWITFYK